MFCSNCGNKINEDAKFCDDCGAEIGDRKTNSKDKQCEYCGNKGQKRGTKYYLLLGVLLFPISTILGIIFPPAWIGIPVGLLIMISAPFIDEKYFCKNCNHEWKIGVTEEKTKSSDKISSPKKLHEKKWFIIVILIIFFPIGLYLMWKSNEFTKNSKIIVTSFFVILVAISGISSEDEQVVNIDEERVLDYEVVGVETNHMKGAERYIYNVVINQKGNIEELKETSKQVVEKAKEDKEFNGLLLFLYDYEEFIDGSYTLGRVRYAPDGEWGKALEVDPGDYDRLEFSWDLRKKNWDKKLTPQEVEVWKEFDDLLWDEAYDDIDDDERLEIVAEKFNISDSDVDDIVIKQRIWSSMDLSE